MGVLVIAFIESAAPPRASPSSLLRMIPVVLTASWKCFATLTASCPNAASATSNISSGFTAAFSCLISSIKSVSICRRPAVSKIIRLAPDD